ncbi:SDR family NAD(P)-dependent oxidoreductase [Myxococcota bacterium]|nr:SDR family NAD(P)-dependent oxidoreductase [Myxococcota bacterium]MBU1534751.1 SDR family NAD(P)-dependent oxidoreductase [Myxococcota bacterium]
MISMEKTFHSPRPLAQVFSYLADLTNFELWDPGVHEVISLSPGPPVTGSRYMVMLAMGPRKVPVDYTLIKVDPAGTIVAKGSGANFTLLDHITLSGTSSGTTITWRLELTLASPSLEPLMRPFMHFTGSRGISGLKRTLGAIRPAPSKPSLPSILGDLMLLPGALSFTKMGFLQARRNFTALDTSMDGKTVVITGATSGLGRSAAASLAALGATLVIIGRDPEKGAQTVANLTQETGNSQIRFVTADLTSVAQTVSVARTLRQELPRVDVLINNAGALFNERKVTHEGYERSFALLLLSPFALTTELLPSLKASPRARIINVTSGGMYTQPIRLDDLQYERGRYDGPKAYARAKRGLLMITETLAALEPGITCNAMHPGWANTPGVALSLPKFYGIMAPLLRTPAMGADTIVWLAASPQAREVSGKLWLDRTPHITAIFPRTQHTARQREQLWTVLQSELSRF